MNDNITNKENIFEFFKGPNSWTQIDNWVPVLDKDVIFKTLKNVISLPVSNFYGVKPNPILDNFIITPKRCYNTKEVRQHICHYMNYFEKYYDTDHELLMIYYRIKYLIDFGMIDMNGNTYQYELDNFLSDIQRYVLSENMYKKVWKMDLENYIVNDLKTDEDIKLYLNTSLKDYIEDGDFNSFYRALEIAIKSRNSISGFAKKIGMSRTHLYSLFKNEKEPKFSTIVKILHE